VRIGAIVLGLLAILLVRTFIEKGSDPGVATAVVAPRSASGFVASIVLWPGVDHPRV